MAGRGPTLLAVFALGVLTGFAAAGWAVAPSGSGMVGAAAANRRADWQPSPVPADWDAPVLPRPAATPTLTTGGAIPRATVPAAAMATLGTPTVPRPASAPAAAGTAAGAVTATAVPAAATTPAAQGAARGEWHEEHLESRVLGRRMPFLIWVPPGYARSQRYPVVYLLHGGGDGQTPGRAEWLQLGMREALDQAAASGELPPAIFVFPEGLGGYWINHAAGGPRWADYVVQDVVAHVDRVWSTEARPERRAVGGLSMGGHAALHLALNHPEAFRIAGAHSPALRSHRDSPPFFGDEAWFARFDPLALAARGRLPARLTVWIDVGESDRWRGESERVAAALRGAGATVALRTFPGRHEGDYWRAHLRDYLRFYGEALKAQ